MLPLFLVGLVVLFFPGCASPGGGGLTLKQIRLDVGWKMEAYQEAVTFRNVTAGQQQQVAAAHQAYQLAFHQALTAANGNLSATAPGNVQQLANQLIATVDGVLSTLVNLSPLRNRPDLTMAARGNSSRP